MDRLQWIDKPGWRPPAMTTLVAVIFVLVGLVAALGVIVLASWFGASESWGSALGGLTIGAALIWVGRSPRK